MVQPTPKPPGAGGREPPPWVPTAAIATLPLTLVAVGVGGTLHVGLAIVALVFGLLVFAALVGVWMVEPNGAGYRAVILISAAVAVAVTGLTVAITWGAQHIESEDTPAATEPPTPDTSPPDTAPPDTAQTSDSAVSPSTTSAATTTTD